ncbi:MAG: MFS transporter, partial [Janthinobacterium lividum]
LAFGDPAQRLWWTVGFSLALGVAGATQDVVIDGWRITAVPPGWQPLMTSWSEVGFRIGNLAAGAGALYLADAIGWLASYLCMALLMMPGMLAAWWAPEPAVDTAPAGPARSLVQIMVEPIRELLTRLGPMAIPVLLLVAGFRMPGYVSSAMAIPLFKHLHYSNSEIATVTKLFGFGITLLGTLTAGVLVPRLGLMVSLLIGTIFASASHLALAYLAAHGGAGEGVGHPAFWIFALAVSVDGFAYAYASIVLITYMSSLASPDHAASQFALLTSLCAFPGSILAGGSGFLIAQLGFTWFFVGTSLIGLPVALLCWYVLHVNRRDGATAMMLSQPK